MSENTCSGAAAVLKHMTAQQKKRLVDIMATKKELRSGKFSERFTKKKAQREWQEIAEILNALPGATKPWQSWRKSWQDLLSKTKSKQGAYNKSINRTGGGSAEAPPLNEIDTNIASMINPRSIHGHTDSHESEAIFNFETQNTSSSDGINESETRQMMTTDDEEQVVVMQIVSDDEDAEPKKTPQNKVNIKSLMKDKLDLKRQVAEAKINFYSSFIEYMEKQTAALQQIALAMQMNK